MQKQEISNIMIFFVTQDLEGQPRQLEMHLMPEKEVSMMNQRFTEYLQRQREMYPCPKPLAGSLSVPLPVSGRSKLPGYPAL